MVWCTVTASGVMTSETTSPACESRPRGASDGPVGSDGNASRIKSASLTTPQMRPRASTTGRHEIRCFARRITTPLMWASAADRDRVLGHHVLHEHVVLRWSGVWALVRASLSLRGSCRDKGPPLRRAVRHRPALRGLDSQVWRTSPEATNAEPIRVYLLDDHEIVRRGIRELLESEGDIVVVGESGSAAEATRLIPALHADVAILDGRLPDGSGIDVCREIRSRDPRRRSTHPHVVRR